ncbi:AAC(3) family N-acetyltransferase [Haloferax mediterranei ATCC 33500]|uniref:AAC(3) family N-acetyltransferase n=1 Tax=Haloferax mediterranei (strain ATCC 33500 / DSM 1411 / JCM 8866 / NBRC 14739 / NCIMB 2177 / R-4) TaxID=523841 RepID=I3R4D5_HALMT|nr:AAC(3) family N-acetyltransferase [Haloferax mediterranei]AFK19095.1 aminoglycoside N3'-acetyltransferase [Haloferax mediterranei ATCC 33500]AHZ21544.1 aminoglycoside 3-N-acetyltransferase [Haloferax mediterranei ATCC 33500]EMA04005.1 aminoglycoside N3-acetyltransferase [Haloferax mediterranei ATCC 33500]MDX5989188.1 AAC(3) family N-acetyltransferase [Haloferax mediterranei ATCC 33500]QCQ75569.1 AAC(3) family N-acetyltransferase [Haloferax mediterranei ATCC 33500]
MSEADAIEQVDEPGTVSSLASDLRALGVEAGDTLTVHSSLRSLGWVSGGPQAVVDALQEVLTESGTLVMPTHSTQYSDPSVWQEPPVPDHWVEIIDDSRPPFRPEVTPTRGMGAIPECFRNYPEAVRSEHPLYSFAAWGADADEIVADHSLDNGLGNESPLARVYDRDGDVLLLGVGHDSNTSLHLAEYRADFEKERKQGTAPLLRDGERVVFEYEDIRIDSDDFEELGSDFESEVGVTAGQVAAATAKLVDQPTLVDFAVDWFEENR